MMRQRLHDTAQFIELGLPTRDELQAAEYLLRMTQRRRLPGGAVSQSYMRMAISLAALLDANEKVNPELAPRQRWPAVLKAMSSTVGVIFGEYLPENAWHEEMEALVRDIHLTARDRRQARLS